MRIAWSSIPAGPLALRLCVIRGSNTSVGGAPLPASLRRQYWHKVSTGAAVYRPKHGLVVASQSGGERDARPCGPLWPLVIGAYSDIHAWRLLSKYRCGRRFGSNRAVVLEPCAQCGMAKLIRQHVRLAKSVHVYRRSQPTRLRRSDSVPIRIQAVIGVFFGRH
jgi:hypothetical protein